LTEKILRELKLDVEQLTLVPGKGGRFEIFVDGDEIYSKLETGEFPDEDVIVSQVVARSR
jgi:selenoprotein W-related protein